MLKNRLEKNRENLLRLYPFLRARRRTPRPPHPQISIRDSSHTYTVFCTPDEQDLKQGEGGIKNFGVLPVALHWKHHPSMEPKSHVYKTPYFVHEVVVMYKFLWEATKQCFS
jgi:hypothetical protein